MAPITSSTMPKVPVTVLVKYSAAITTAAKMRRIRSVVPMFFFITEFFYEKIRCTSNTAPVIRARQMMQTRINLKILFFTPVNLNASCVIKGDLGHLIAYCPDHCTTIFPL